MAPYKDAFQENVRDQRLAMTHAQRLADVHTKVAHVCHSWKRAVVVPNKLGKMQHAHIEVVQEAQ